MLEIKDENTKDHLRQFLILRFYRVLLFIAVLFKQKNTPHIEIMTDDKG